MPDTDSDTDSDTDTNDLGAIDWAAHPSTVAGIQVRAETTESVEMKGWQCLILLLLVILIVWC